MLHVICPFCAADTYLGRSWTAPLFTCARCYRLVALGEDLRRSQFQFLTALAAGFVGVFVAAINAIIEAASLPPPPPNPADKGPEGALIFLNAWIVFFGVTSAVGQMIYRARGERGSEENLRRGLGRVLVYGDAACGLWLIGTGLFALCTGLGIQLSLVIGPALLAHVRLVLRRARRSSRSSLAPDSPTIVSDLLECAREEALAYAQPCADGQHLLLAIARLRDHPVVAALAARGATEERIRTVLAPRTAASSPGLVGAIVLSAEVEGAVDRAMRTVRDSVDELTKPERLLRALLADPENNATRLLVYFGIEIGELRAALAAQIKAVRRSGRLVRSQLRHGASGERPPAPQSNSEADSRAEGAESDEPIARYQESRFGLRRRFELYPDRVRVFGRGSSVGRFDVTVPLALLNPEPRRVWFRGRLFWWGLNVMGLAGGFVFPLFLGLAPNLLGWGSACVLLGLLVVVGLILMVLGRQRFECVQFRSGAGVLILDVGQMGPDADRYHSFVELLITQIREAGGDTGTVSGADR